MGYTQTRNGDKNTYSPVVGGWRLVKWGCNQPKWGCVYHAEFGGWAIPWQKDVSRGQSFHLRHRSCWVFETTDFFSIIYCSTGYPGFCMFFSTILSFKHSPKGFKQRKNGQFKRLSAHNNFPYKQIRGRIDAFFKYRLFSCLNRFWKIRHFQVRTNDSNGMVPYYGVPFHE